MPSEKREELGRHYLDPQPVDCPRPHHLLLDGERCPTCLGSGKVRRCECPCNWPTCKCNGTGYIPAGEPEIEVHDTATGWWWAVGNSDLSGPFPSPEAALAAAREKGGE